jgi:methionine synthase II (cobalamin-independent)
VDPGKLKAVKGQVSGPITFCTALKDRAGRAIFYHDGLRDAAIKLLALKAAWQVSKLKSFGVPVIIFIDEPALAGYGSSELISISAEQISASLEEVIAAVHAQGGLAGVHVCANTDWSLLLNSSVDIINFDAYGYFDKFILYGEQIRTFLNSGRYLAWGLVPTLRREEVAAVNLEILWQLWQSQSKRIAELGIDEKTLRRQSFITPSCGTGSLPRDAGQKVLVLTQALSQRIRESGGVTITRGTP